MVATGWVVVQSTWLRREFIFPEREGIKGEREHFQEREEFKKGIQEGIQEGEEKCVLGI